MYNIIHCNQSNSEKIEDHVFHLKLTLQASDNVNMLSGSVVSV